MSYQVLARKWRPRDFASLVGQEHVVRALTHALEQQRLHHAYLFTGTRGVGKTTLSRILAKSFNCTGPDGSGGITATPCNVCDACTAIDAGRFVDYIEMDAASYRGVDDMVALLERAVYAPSNARFKVYMIDEVHMLSKHAFNAMLKTLEEPPEYVRFILATTDPQQVPVTVLSRCLQFNLKQMAPAAVADHLRAIVGQEGIRADDAALRMLGQAARGSMRDGLSLLDQAIAYSAGEVTLDAVRGMLGAIDTTLLIRALDAVTRRDAAGLISVADEMATRSFSFAQGLRDLASLLHRIALAQRVGGTLEDGEDGAAIVDLSQRLAPDEVQLYYQIALHGRNDLHLAPDDYAGFTMTLLRMLAFAPDAKAGEIAPMRPAALVATKPPRAAVPAPAASPKGGATTPASIVAARPSAAPAAVDRQADSTKAAQVRTAVPQVLAARLVEAAPVTEPVPCAGEAQAPFDGDWPALVTRLPVQGLTRQLAAQAELVARDGDLFRLRVPTRTLADASNIERLRSGLTQYFGRPIRVSVDVGVVAGPTAAAIAEQVRAERQKRAEAAIYDDPIVKQLIDNFGARVDPDSIHPND
jgi:DNA polymerase III subunit gamma/tau